MSTDVVQIPFALLHQDEPVAHIEAIGIAVLQSPHSNVHRLAVGVNEDLIQNGRPEALTLVTSTKIQMLQE